MIELLRGLNEVFSTFGASVFVPLFLFVIARCVGVKGKKAFNSALLCAVGLTGFNLVITTYGSTISPIVKW